MPCYLFTYHAYGSWMPDRKEGYVDRILGQRPSDPGMARAYREGMEDLQAEFGEREQLAVIESLIEGVEHIECRLHSVATEPSHFHVLVSWSNENRKWMQNRSSLKKAATFALKRDSERKRWLSEGASRKRVVDQNHFDHLVGKYLPSHRGWKWDENRGLYR